MRLQTGPVKTKQNVIYALLIANLIATIVGYFV